MNHRGVVIRVQGSGVEGGDLARADLPRVEAKLWTLSLRTSDAWGSPGARICGTLGHRMTKLTEADLRFLEAFETGEVAGFGHREHLRLAYIYLTLHSFDEALEKMDSGLRRLLARFGAPASKFHRTLTQVWLLAVDHFMHAAGPTRGFEDFLRTDGRRLLDKDLVGTHYSPELLWSEEARLRFVEPDLQPIPRHVRGAQPFSYLSPKTAVRESPIHGQGLFAAAAIAKDEIVAVKGGHIISRQTLDELAPRIGSAEIQIADDLFICPASEIEREGSMIFSNHSCDPNLGVRGEITFVAMREIGGGEELTHDWAMTDDDDSSTVCQCGAGICRGTITGKDWQQPDLQERYRGYFSAYLLEKMRLRSGRTVRKAGAL